MIVVCEKEYRGKLMDNFMIGLYGKYDYIKLWSKYNTEEL